MSEQELGEVIVGGVFLMGLVLGIFGSFILNRKLHARQPHVRPFKWGYFNGIVAAVWLPFAVLALLVSPASYYTSEEYLGIYCLMAVGIAGVFVIKRSRAAFLVLTFISLNPVGWIINGIYLKRRWQELASVPAGKAMRPASAPQSQLRDTSVNPQRVPSSGLSLNPVSDPAFRSQPPPRSPAPVVNRSAAASGSMNKPNVSVPPAEIYIAVNGEKEGPFTIAEILERLRTSTTHRTCLYWQPGMEQWRPLRELADKLLQTGR